MIGPRQMTRREQRPGPTWRPISLLLIPIIAGAPAAAQSTSQPAATQRAAGPAGSQPVEGGAGKPAGLESQYGPLDAGAPWATGDWLGIRSALEDGGVSFKLFYNNTYQWNVRGGNDTTGRNGATIDAFLEFDFEKLRLIPGGRLCAHARWQQGAGANPAVGGLWQAADDLDGDLELHLDQLWYEQDLFDQRLTLRLGYLDCQTIVDRNAYANSEDRQFMHQALDNNPLLPLQIGLGASLTLRPAPWLHLIAASVDSQGRLTRAGFDTAFHGPARYVSFFEIGVAPQLPNLLGSGRLPGNYRLGAVLDPRPRAIFEDPAVQPPRRPTRGDDWGWYLSCDQAVFRENDRDAQGLGVFARYGWRRDDVNRSEHVWSAGVQYEGLIPRRDRDVLGFGVFQGLPSEPFREFVDASAKAETGYELYYAIEVTRWFKITPDIQYIAHPGASHRLRDAIVLGLRAQISF